MVVILVYKWHHLILRCFYPLNILQAQNVTLSLNDPPGEMALGGTLDQCGAILIAALHFEVDRQPIDVVEFSGVINQFHDINEMRRKEYLWLAM